MLGAGKTSPAQEPRMHSNQAREAAKAGLRPDPASTGLLFRAPLPMCDGVTTALPIC